METTQKPDYENAKNNALDLLKYFGIDEAPINPAKMARELGITVNFAEFPHHNNVSGFYSLHQNAIYVNVKEYSYRMTFTIAHELGHQRLHKEQIIAGNYKALFRDQLFSQFEKDPKEQEANTFAAHLLVPRFLLDKYSIKKLLENGLISISDVATMFAVSQPVAKFRVKNEYGL